MKVLLDTHIWLQFLAGDKSLSKKIINLIDDQKTNCLLSPISIWEASILIEKKKINIKGKFDNWLTKALENFPVHDAPLTQSISRAISTLNFKHKDPADHIIAATAYIYSVPLVTNDEELKKLKWLETISY